MPALCQPLSLGCRPAAGAAPAQAPRSGGWARPRTAWGGPLLRQRHLPPSRFLGDSGPISTWGQVAPVRGVSVDAPRQTESGIRGDGYYVSDEDVWFFHENGYVHLPKVLTEEEIAAEIEGVYDSFVRGEIDVTGGDLCDMSGAVGRQLDNFSIVNAMLPRRYYPAWQGNILERRTKAIADRLQGGGMEIDYDQILAKRPQREDAVFAWHQDMAYWPPFESDTATATCWFALDDTTPENGCMRFCAGTHREGAVREHHPVASSQKESHALYTHVDEEAEDTHYIPIRRGDITVHNELVVHGSGPNRSDGYRRAYVVAYRKKECIAEERSYGFTHSHNDEFNWEVFRSHQREREGSSS